MADITVTIPNSTFTITEVGSGIEVTTPTSVEVNVDSNSNTIDITNTPQEITILTSGTLNINTGNAVTSVNGISGPTVVLDTDDISEGTTNQYFTTSRARQSLSAGTGISYDNATGVITNTSINTNTTYTIDATTATGGANFNLVGSDSSTDTIKIASGTNITVSRTDANTITIDGSDLNTTYAISSASTTGGANLTLTGSDSSTDSVAYKGSGATTVTSTDANTITIASTDTNTTYTQNASATSGGANLNLVGSDSTTDTIKFAEGTGITVVRTDADTITITNTVPDTNTTYTISSGATSGGANLTLTGSDASTDSVAYLGSGATTVTSTDANTVTISSTDTNTTYTQNASAVSGGANLNLVGSDSTTDSIKLASGTNVTVTRTDADTVTIASTDTNTTYTQNISSTSGGANLNLVGSDSTTDTVKFADGTGVTVSYTDANTATIAIGQSVGTGDSPSFAGGTFGNITVGVATDQTITTTSGDLILDSNSGTVSLNVPTITTDATTLALFNTTATTVNAFGAATTAVNIGTANGSIVKGPNRFTSPTINAFQGSASPSRGLSISNGNGASAALARNAILLRSYPTSGGARGVLLFENARGTESVPTAITSGDFIGEVSATGYATNGWLSDYVVAVPGVAQFVATETWANTGGPYPTAGTVTNAGTGYQIALHPTATNVTDVNGSRISVLNINPQTFTSRSDAFTWTTGKTLPATTTMALDVSGNLTITGDLTVTGNDIKSSSATALTLSGADVAVAGDLTVTGNDIKSSSATALTLSGADVAVAGDLRINGNDIQASDGSSAISLTSGNTQTTIRGDQFKVNNAADTNFITVENQSGKTVLSINQTRATSASDFATANWTTQRSTDGINYTPTLSNDFLGEFKFNGNAYTSTSPGVPGAPGGNVVVKATENWSSTANGTSMQFFAIKQGTLDSYSVLSANPSGSSFTADSFTFQTAAASPVTLATVDSSGLTLAGTLDVQGGTITDSTGALSITTGAGNGAITLDPNGTGNVVLTFANGGNLTNDRNYVFGAVRNSTTAGLGDIWALNTTGTVQPFRGISIDNSSDTARLPGYVARSYSNTAGFRGRLILERARGTAASPTAVQAGDFLGEVAATGYSSTGWINDTLTAVPGFFGFTANENWVSNTALGTAFALSLAPTATTISTSANLVACLAITPQVFASRSDSFTWANGKTGTTQTMALDVSGNLTVTGDIRINGNDIQNSGGTSAITLSSANATTTIKGDAITLEDNAGTDYAVLNSTSATFAQPVGLPVKTAAQWNAITGAVGRMVCVSDSAQGSNPNGMIAFWDTTHSRWSYIHDNSAV